MTLEEIGRAAIEAHLSGRPFAPPSGERTAAVFVTLRAPDGVRSLGTTRPDAPLPQLVARLAVLAATEDPRGVPLPSAEELEVIVSVLDDPRPVRTPADLDPALDAVSIRRGVQAATLLPVATAGRGWDSRTVLAVLCQKAGLPRAAWEDPEAVVEARRVRGPAPG